MPNMASYSAMIKIGQQLSKKHQLVDCVWDRIKSLDIIKPVRGSRAGVNLQRLIETWISSHACNIGCAKGNSQGT